HVRRPDMTPAGGTIDPASTPLHWLLGPGMQKGKPSRSQASFIFLFGATPRLFVITGVWVALIFLVVHLFTSRGSMAPQRNWGSQLLFMLPFVAFFHSAIGTSTARRARLLWLRADMNRSA